MKLFRSIAIIALVLGVAGCAPALDEQGGEAGSTHKPLVAVTTNILGDIVTELAGEEAEILVLIPAGSDPHNYQPSTRDVAKMMQADLIVENGLGLEESFAASLKAARADKVRVLTVGDFVDPLSINHEADEHDHHDDDDHDHGPLDPHFWHDPARMALAVDAIAEELMGLTNVDGGRITENLAQYKAILQELDRELAEEYASIPRQKRLLVTGHHVFGYLAAAYDFEVVGSIVASSSTLAEPSAAEIADIAKKLSDLGVSAVFTDESQSAKTAEAVIAESGADIKVVPLFSESLTPRGGEADSYVELMQVNAERIVAALVGP